MKNIYTKLPESLQNLILTIVNTYKYYQKYGAIPVLRPLSKVIKKLNIENFNDSNTLDRINSLIRYATENVPYYQKNKEEYKTIQSISDLKELPILKKTTLKEHNADFLSKEVNHFNSYSFRTSGSTGTPIFGAVKYADLKLRFKMFLISLKMENIDYSKP